MNIKKRYSQKNLLQALSGVLLLVLLVYLPVLNNEFVNWDDDAHLLKNPFIRALDGKHIQDIFSTTVNKIYIPLTSLSFSLEHHFFGDHPFIYHFDNVLLHLMVTAFVMLFSLRCGLSLRAGVMAALLFGLHPMHVESVAWITERKDVLYTFFYMLALLCYCEYLTGHAGDRRKGEGMRYLILTLIFGFLSILSKPMALSLPLILFILDWFYKRKVSWGSIIEKLSLGCLFLPVIWVTYQLHMRVVDLKFPSSFLIWIWSFVFHIKKFFYPDYFVLLYKLPAPVTVMNPEYLSSLIIFAGLLVSLWFFRKHRWFVFAFFFYLASIFFLLRWDQKADINIVADRFMYLPSMGMCLWVGDLCDKIWRKGKQKIHGARHDKLFLTVMGVSVFGLLSFQTIKQGQVWRNGVSLWRHQLKKQSKVATALIYNNLGQALVQEDTFREVLNRYKSSDTSWAEAQNSSGDIELRTKDKEAILKVIFYYQNAFRIKPDFDNAYLNLGKLYADLGEVRAAKIHYEKAIELHPLNFEAYYQMGELWQQIGNDEEAIEAFRKALRSNLDNEEMYIRLIDAYIKMTKTAQNPQIYQIELNNLSRLYKLRFP